MNEFLTRAQVATMFKLPIRTVDYLVSTGQIPFSRLGKRTVRFSLERLEKWFREREGVEYHTEKGQEENAELEVEPCH